MSTRPSALLALLVVAAATSAPLSAQAPATARDTARLEAEVVTATRLPGVLRTQTATVTVLDGEALRRGGVTHLAEALRAVPGAAVVGGGSFGAQTSLFLRGGQSGYTRVLVDGVPVNDPGGAIDLARITLDDVERVEVVRGPTSVLYGSDAVTGVIQLFTRSGLGPRTVHAELGGGFYGGRRASLGAQGGSDRLRWTLHGDAQRSDGILPFNNGYRTDGVSSSLRFVPDAASDLRVTARYHTSVYRYPTDGSGRIEDRNAHSVHHRLLLGLDAGRRWSERVETRLQLSSSEFLPRTIDRPDGPSDNAGMYAYASRATVTRRLADLRANVRLAGDQVLTLGGEFARDHENGSSLAETEFGDFPGAFTAARETRAAYAQLAGNRGILSYTAGLRQDANSAFGDFTTARLGLAARVHARLTLRASLGNAFKAPTFFENFAEGFTVGNPDLAPERSRAAELGAEARVAGAALRVTGFTQRFRDLIQYNGSVAMGEPNYANIAEAKAGGLELELGLPAILGTAVTASHSWLDGRVVRGGFDTSSGATFVDGGRLIRRPAHLARLRAARAVGDAGSVTLAVTRVGAREDRDFSGWPAVPVTLAAYARLDLAGDWGLPARVLRDARLVLRADNVLGAAYQEVHGFDAPGRVLYAGLKLQR